MARLWPEILKMVTYFCLSFVLRAWMGLWRTLANITSVSLLPSTLVTMTCQTSNFSPQIMAKSWKLDYVIAM